MLYSGPTVLHTFSFIFNMAFSGTNGYYANFYQEQHSVTNKFSISDPQSITHLLGDKAGASPQHL